MVFRHLNIQAHYNEAVMYLNFGTPRIMNFSFGTNGKFIIFRCPLGYFLLINVKMPTIVGILIFMSRKN